MRRNRFRPAVSGLEARNLLSAAGADFPPPVEYEATSFGTLAIVSGTKHADTIAVSGDPFAGGLTLDYNGTVIPLAAGTRFVAIDGKDGPDTFIISANAEVTVHGGAGDDTFIVDPAASGSYTLRGDAGSDTLVGGSDFTTFFVAEPDSFEPFDLDVLAQGKVIWIYTRATNGVEDNVVTVEDGLITIDGISTVLYDPNFTRTLLISTNDGRDVVVDSSTDTRVVVYGGDGRDILVGDAGDSLYGEQGSDSITYG